MRASSSVMMTRETNPESVPSYSSGGKIHGGWRLDILRMKGPQTQVIDLKPWHPASSTLTFTYTTTSLNPEVNGGTNLFPTIQIGDLDPKESLLRALRKKAQELGPREGWHVLPTREPRRTHPD